VSIFIILSLKEGMMKSPELEEDPKIAMMNGDSEPTVFSQKNDPFFPVPSEVVRGLALVAAASLMGFPPDKVIKKAREIFPDFPKEEVWELMRKVLSEIDQDQDIVATNLSLLIRSFFQNWDNDSC